MKRLLLLIFILLIQKTLLAQNFTLDLYNAEIPNSRITTTLESADTTDIVRISHVQKPTIEVYLPAKKSATGQAVIICPGGGYGILAYDWEGTDVAKFLNGHGIAGIVLKYRLPDDDSNAEPHKSPLMDAKQAMKRVRANSRKWNIDPKKLGVMGFSAGGHLASTLGTHFDEDSRPDFMALIYPVISFDLSFTHKGSRRNLIGENPSESLVTFYSNEKQIKENTPPTFILHTSDDKVVPVENSLAFYRGLLEKDISAEMHIYPNGGHGFGLATKTPHLETWPTRLIDWLKEME